jgi:lipopolysaccharide/colanic/teichoic acid biosynthesis glycosyltransferase
MTGWAEIGDGNDSAERETFQALEAGESNPYTGFKPLLDFLLAVPLLVLAAPFMLLSMLAVKLTSRGPAIYKQTRLGLNGRPYTIYKIRTMSFDCERLTGARWSTPGDPRVTPVGRFLRTTHLDELPQLWNILRGEMSLVGPRPERPEFVTQLERAMPHYRCRMLIRPGVTGLAQVQLPPDQDLAGVRRKLAFDLFYVRNASPWLDLKIVLATASGIFGVPFAVPRVLLRIPSGRVVEAADPGLPEPAKVLTA